MKPIKDEAEYSAALERLDDLWDRGLSTSDEFIEIEQAVLNYEAEIASLDRCHKVATAWN